MNLIDKHAPLRERVVTVRPKAPWYNSEIDTAIRLRRKLEHKWLKTKSQIDHDNFRQQCAVVNDLILKSKETFYNGKIEDCDGDQNWLFKVIQNGVKPSFNETVKKSCFHVDLSMLKYKWHFQCSVDTRNRVKMKKILEKSVLVLDYISAQLCQFTTSGCTLWHSREALILWTTDNIRC